MKKGKGVLTVLALLTGMAQAHPVDEVVQGAYLTLAPGAVQLELDLTPGPLVAGPFITALDPNADGRVTVNEARAYAVSVLRQSTLTIDGKAAGWTVDRVDVPSLESLKVGSDTLKIYATARRPDRAGAATLSYQNRYQPANSQWMANVFLLPGAGWTYRVSGQQHSNDGRQLTVTYVAART
ncbi:hypothetical protein [Deinococcus sonorensis]|uniref:EF-hand domain-containing protein n=2 Tax=Deinococcus sonorensis TaxID=309891 RepID=A0AAU7U6X5_9DEIO